MQKKTIIWLLLPLLIFLIGCNQSPSNTNEVKSNSPACRQCSQELSAAMENCGRDPNPPLIPLTLLGVQAQGGDICVAINQETNFNSNNYNYQSDSNNQCFNIETVNCNVPPCFVVERQDMTQCIDAVQGFAETIIDAGSAFYTVLSQLRNQAGGGTITHTEQSSGDSKPSGDRSKSLSGIQYRGNIPDDCSARSLNGQIHSLVCMLKSKDGQQKEVEIPVEDAKKSKAFSSFFE